MIKDGENIYLYDTKKANVPGVNPIMLRSLKDYQEYLNWQRANKLSCPILHLEKVMTTQGTEMYEIRPNFLEDIDGGISYDMAPERKKIIDEVLFNTNQFPGYDPMDQTQGAVDAMTTLHSG